MSTRSFDGDVVVISGAGRGLGKAYAEHLSSLDARVVVNDIDADVAHETARVLGAARAVACPSDVSTADGAGATIAAALDTFGRVDAIVCNAGWSWHLPFAECTEADLRRVLEDHLFGTFHMIKAAWPHFAAQARGRIVTTSSGAIFGYAGRSHYAAAKGAVLGLTNNVALEGKPLGILANTILPQADTRLAGPDSNAPDASLAAPPVARLCHRDCTDNGRLFVTGGDRFARVVFERRPVDER